LNACEVDEIAREGGCKQANKASWEARRRRTVVITTTGGPVD
jgi:hypothetical protein